MLLIYGSTGYTGRLIVAEALARRLRPTLAARNAEAVRAHAQSLGLEWRTASMDYPASLEARMRGASGYVMTAQTAVHPAVKALAGEAPVGFQTPSRAYGADVILEIPGVIRTDVA